MLTHAHLDHCGYLPRLVSGGFRGRIFCTPGTKELTGVVLRDAARLQEEDAKEANRYGYTKHNPALPLYTQIDAARAIDRLQPVGYERPSPLWSAGRSGESSGIRPVPVSVARTNQEPYMSLDAYGRELKLGAYAGIAYAAFSLV